LCARQTLIYIAFDGFTFEHMKEIGDALDPCRAFFETAKTIPGRRRGSPGTVARPDAGERLTDRNGFGNAAVLSKSRRSGFDGDGTLPTTQPSEEPMSRPPWAQID
jgi:hypothetical protein